MPSPLLALFDNHKAPPPRKARAATPSADRLHQAAAHPPHRATVHPIVSLGELISGDA